MKSYEGDLQKAGFGQCHDSTEVLDTWLLS